MKYFILILISTLFLVYGCKDNTTDAPQTGSVLLYERSGLYDSLSNNSSIMPIDPTDYDTTINFTSFSSVRFTFDYNAKADSIIFKFRKWYQSGILLTFKRLQINTNNSYTSFDSTLSLPTNASGDYGRFIYSYRDSSYFSIRNFKVYGVY